MAGDWIKMRVNLANDPAVKAMARALKIDPFSVVGRLHMFWAWADEHTENGDIPWVTLTDIDELVSKRGFAEQLVKVEWLIDLGDAVRLPNFERHNGDSAKRRATETEKKRRQRSGTSNPTECPDDVPLLAGPKPDNTGTREEKRREEKSNTSTPPTASPATVEIVFPMTLNSPEFSDAWMNWAQHRREIKKPITPTAQKEQIKKLEEMGLQRAIAALRHSTANQYQGIFEPDSKPGSAQLPTPVRVNIA